MRLTRLFVENYRALEQCKVDVSDDLTVIVGKNNTGKTSLVGVLSKFLSGNRFVYDDLNIHAKKKLYKSVMGESKAIKSNIGVCLTLVITYTDDDSLKNIRPLLMSLEEDNYEVGIRFARYVDAARIEKIKIEFQSYCAGLGIDCSPELFEKFMVQRQDRYFTTWTAPVYCKNGTPDYERLGQPLKTDQIKRIISFDYVDALRSVSNKESSSTLGDRIANYYSSFKSSSLEPQSNELLNALLAMDKKLDDVYGELFAGLSDSIKLFSGFHENGACPEVTSHLSDQDLIASNTAVTYQSSEGDTLPESHNGLGYMNIMSIIMDIEAKSEKFKHESDDGEPSEVNLLFVEEPEAHTHPQLQITFIQQLKKYIIGLRGLKGHGEISLQCMLTTHSAHIVANADFEDMRYLVRGDGESTRVKNLSELKALYDKEDNQGRANYKFIKQYLTLDRADVFFADKVILIEGDTERILMPAMMSKVDVLHHDDGNWNNLLSQEISVVPAGAYARVFLPLVDFLGLKTLIITDSDFVQGTNHKSCSYEELEATSNQTIRELLPEESANTASLKDLYSCQKVHTFSAQGNDWIDDPDGELCLTFQTGPKSGYHARSFEDAFISENEPFLSEHIDSFRAIRTDRAKRIFKNKIRLDPYVCASLIAKKTSFAMDILLSEQRDSSDEDDRWNVPSYIERGLVWLAKN